MAVATRRLAMATLMGGAVAAWSAKARVPGQQERPEPVLFPDLPIVDPHHHLWDGWPDRKVPRYHAPELLADMDSGHRIVATVFIECNSHYETSGDPLLRPVGETRFVVEQAAADPRIARGIVGYADMMSRARVEDVLAAQIEAGRGHFRGVRQSSPFDADPARGITDPLMGTRLDDPAFREGFARLARHGLSFDGWCFHTNLHQFGRLAAAFPDTVIVLDHIGSPLGIGKDALSPQAMFAQWRTNIARVAACPNVAVKFGGLGMPMGGPSLVTQGAPRSSVQLAQVWRPWFEACLDLFGPKRMMFESNFPVDAGNGDYRTLWNAFKRLAAPLSTDERTDLFSRTAAATYRLDLS